MRTSHKLVEIPTDPEFWTNVAPTADRRNETDNGPQNPYNEDEDPAEEGNVIRFIKWYNYSSSVDRFAVSAASCASAFRF